MMSIGMTGGFLLGFGVAAPVHRRLCGLLLGICPVYLDGCPRIVIGTLGHLREGKIVAVHIVDAQPLRGHLPGDGKERGGKGTALP